jgi:hypothetical protein
MRRRLFLGRLALLGTLVVNRVFLGEGLAKDAKDPDQPAIEKVVRAQLAAFGHDDAVLAFSFATPAVQRQFGNAERFLNSIKTLYQPVYRPGDLAFLPLNRDKGKVVQPLQIAMADGKVWMAFYDMQQQPDRSWRINGCRLAITDDVST